MFINPNEYTFSELSNEEKGLLLLAHHEGKIIERMSRKENYTGFKPIDNPQWNDEVIYRVTPEKPNINWDHVSPEYNWLAKDKSGFHYLYQSESKPKFDKDGFWFTKESNNINAEIFASFKSGNCEAKDSLVSRPK